MENITLATLANQLLADAHTGNSGRSAKALIPGRHRTMKQNILALAAGHGLAEHDNPGEASLHVLRGHVTITCGDATWTGTAGDFVVIPDERHDLHAVEDSVVIISLVRKPRPVDVILGEHA